MAIIFSVTQQRSYIFASNTCMSLLSVAWLIECTHKTAKEICHFPIEHVTNLGVSDILHLFTFHIY